MRWLFEGWRERERESGLFSRAKSGVVVVVVVVGCMCDVGIAIPQIDRKNHHTLEEATVDLVSVFLGDEHGGCECTTMEDNRLTPDNVERRRRERGGRRSKSNERLSWLLARDWSI
jgi:hypothetical protein